MTEPADTFTELSRRGHEVFTAAVRAWEQAARSMAEAAGRPGTQVPDVSASVDAAFDFAARMLAEQRDFTRTLMSAGARTFAAAQPPIVDAATETADASGVPPAQDADQPGADTPGALDAPDSPAARKDAGTAAPQRETTVATPATPAPESAGPTAAPGPEAATDGAGPAAKKTTARTTARTTTRTTAAPGTPVKRAAPRSEDES